MQGCRGTEFRVSGFTGGTGHSCPGILPDTIRFRVQLQVLS